MPNQLLNTGLQIKSTVEITDDIIEKLQAVYGADINVQQNSPDGQLINIFGQAAQDILELVVAVYNSFSLENAYGKVLDERVALNGLTRRAGTYTITLVAVIVDRAVNLVGLDGKTVPDGSEFVVSDDGGNQFILISSDSFAGPGTYGRTFRAKDLGAVNVLRNTIINQETVTIGVTQVYNPDDPSSVGAEEETDSQLKIRHARSFYLAATGPAEAVQAALLAIADVTDAFVGENATTVPAGGITAHSIWCIVEGGTDIEIAQAIYSKKAPGCGMVGTVTYTLTRPAGNTIAIKFDRSVNETLYVKFGITPKVPGAAFDPVEIAASLVAALTYRINQQATIGDVVAAMLTIAPQGYLTSLGVSKDGVTYLDNVVPTLIQNKFVLTTGRVIIT